MNADHFDVFVDCIKLALFINRRFVKYEFV